MATEKDEIMARSGPEDNLVAVATNVNSSEFRTAGNDWVVSRASHFAPEALHYKDATEQARLTAQLLSKGATGDIMRDLVMQRNLCAKQVYMNKVGARRAREECGWAVRPPVRARARARGALTAAAAIAVHAPLLLAALLGRLQGAPAKAVHAHNVGVRQVRHQAVSRRGAAGLRHTSGWLRASEAARARPRRDGTRARLRACVPHAAPHPGTHARRAAGCRPQPRWRTDQLTHTHTRARRRPARRPCADYSARAVDILCRKPFWDYQQCVDKSGKGAKECVSKWTAFDQCTEDF